MTVGLGLATQAPPGNTPDLPPAPRQGHPVIVMFCANVALLVFAAFFFSVYTEEM